MSINKKIVFCNIGFVAMFLAAYSVNRWLMVVAALIPTLYILKNRELSFGVAEILFLLPFASTMNVSIGTTSLFMLPKLALIIAYFIQRKMKMDVRILLSFLLFFVYSLLTNLIKGSFPIVRIMNLILWFTIAFIVYRSLETTVEMTISCGSYIGGVTLSGVIGLLKSYLPNLSNDLISAQYLNESTGAIVQRFAGLWNDPNGYTVFIICALFSAFWLFDNKKISILIFAILSANLSALGIMTLSKSCLLLIVLFWIYFVLSNRGMSLKRKVGSVIAIGILYIAGASMYQSELMELIYRFSSSGGSNSSFNISVLTTHRSTIWVDYISTILENDFMFGFGIDAPVVNGFACHNTYLQLWYEWGIIGTIIYVSVWIRMMIEKKKKISVIPLLFLLVTIFFISCVYIEYIYILLPLVLCIGKVSCYEKRIISHSIQNN